MLGRLISLLRGSGRLAAGLLAAAASGATVALAMALR